MKIAYANVTSAEVKDAREEALSSVLDSEKTNLIFLPLGFLQIFTMGFIFLLFLFKMVEKIENLDFFTTSLYTLFLYV